MGSFSILNNIASVNGQNQLNINNVALSRTFNRLSSGKRINTGADDAAGLQIADSLRANVAALNQAVRNANDGISVAQIADGALQQITDLLTRGVTLAEEAATETIDSKGKAALNKEFGYIISEIERISLATNFNGQSIFVNNKSFTDNTLSIFVGDISVTDDTAGVIKLSIGAINKGTGSHVTFDTTNLSKVDLAQVTSTATVFNATAALSIMATALNDVSNMRGSIGAGMNRLQAAVAVLQTQSQNTLSAESSVRDANIAEEISSMTKHQILAQTGIAALAQANSNSQIVLSLLR